MPRRPAALGEGIRLPFKKIDAPSIKELFLTQVEEMILSGELKPGDPLPPERALADEMGISKTIVHEGIRELARMGFLRVAARKGVYVADYASTGNLDTLLAIIRYRGGMPDKKMLIDLLNARLYLECPALEELARRRDPAALQELEALLEEVRRALPGDARAFAAALFNYRKAVAALSGNCITPLIMNAFFTASIDAWADYCEFIGRQQTCDMLARTTEHIRNGDAEAAIREFTRSIEAYKAHLLG